ncbi:hypothetical protein ABG067_008618, partial [Albugo candida]
MRNASPCLHADAEAEGATEQIRIGAVRRQAGFGHEQRLAIEQIGHVDEELRLNLACDAHVLRQIEVGVEQPGELIIVI